MAKVFKGMADIARHLCDHRVIHAGVALAYGAGLAGVCDKHVVEGVVMAAYAIMAARG